MNEILNQLEENIARVERVIFLAGALSVPESIPDDLDDFFDEDEATIKNCLGNLPDFLDEDMPRYERSEHIIEWLQQDNKYGFLLKIATPVMLEGLEGSYSWGYYSTRWVYGETIEQAVDKGIEWVIASRNEGASK